MSVTVSVTSERGPTISEEGRRAERATEPALASALACSHGLILPDPSRLGCVCRESRSWQFTMHARVGAGVGEGRGVFTPYASPLMRKCASAVQPPPRGLLPALLVGGCRKLGLNTN